MREYVPSLLWSWAVASPLLFRLLPGRDAAIACLVLGWALLPVAPFPPTALADASREASAHAVALPTSMLVNKATAIGLGCLAGLILFDRRTFGRLRFDRFDLPIVAWCLAPMASTASNGLPLSEGLSQVRYLALAWGGPYLMGRAYLADAESRGRFAVALAAGGLAYLPLCLLEVVAGPSAYRVAYGPHPYEFEGAARLLGHRPLGFQEHGNQLGMWMASSAVAATWLWASGAVKRPGGIPGGLLAASLIGATLLCQSHASILLMGLALLPLPIARVSRGQAPWKGAAAVVVGLGASVAFLLAARRGFHLGALRVDAAHFFRGISKSSFTWRLARSEEFLPIAMQRPWLGWARADWKPGGVPFVNPVNLPLGLLALGMYGVVGLAAMTATWIVPLALAIGRRHPSRPGPGGGATGAMIALVAITFLDSFSNSTVILPILAAVGGLNPPTDRRRV
jgi:hypothetical protein